MIRKTFEYLNFKVKIFTDLKDDEIKSKLSKQLNKTICYFHDCFVLYIQSYGKENGFITANNKIIEYHQIIKLFSDKECQKFYGKPKLIFFDCGKDNQYSTSLDFGKPDVPRGVNVSFYSDLFVISSTLRSKFVEQ